MKKLILFFVVAFLGVTLTVGAFAGPKVEGWVYFDISTGEQANCTSVVLYSDQGCYPQNKSLETTTGCCGEYMFWVLPYTTYYVQATFTGTDCLRCDFSGTCNYTVSDCIIADIVDSTDVTVNIDLELTACYNSTCDP
jgi:hypothetical protein